MDKKFDDVFLSHPTAKEIYVVGEQPFLDKQQAENYARGSKLDVVTIAAPKSKEDKAVKAKVSDAKTAEKAATKKEVVQPAQDDATPEKEVSEE